MREDKALGCMDRERRGEHGAKNETSRRTCERESERLRQRDKTGELMSDRGRVSV